VRPAVEGEGGGVVPLDTEPEVREAPADAEGLTGPQETPADPAPAEMAPGRGGRCVPRAAVATGPPLHARRATFSAGWFELAVGCHQPPTVICEY